MKPHLSTFAVPSEPPLPGPSARRASPQRCWARPCSPSAPRGGAWARRPLRPRYSAPSPPTRGPRPAPPTHGFSRPELLGSLPPRPTPPYRPLTEPTSRRPCPSHALSAPEFPPRRAYRSGPSAPAHAACRPPGSRMTTPNCPPARPFLLEHEARRCLTPTPKHTRAHTSNATSRPGQTRASHPDAAPPAPPCFTISACPSAPLSGALAPSPSQALGFPAGPPGPVPEPLRPGRPLRPPDSPPSH